jgi:hypothetical protein
MNPGPISMSLTAGACLARDRVLGAMLRLLQSAFGVALPVFEMISDPVSSRTTWEPSALLILGPYSRNHIPVYEKLCKARAALERCADQR